MKISLYSNSLSNYSLEEILSLNIASLFDEMELWEKHIMQKTSPPNKNFFALNGYFELQYDSLEDFNKYLALAKRFKCKNIRVFAGRIKGDCKEAIKIICKNLNKILQMSAANNAGVILELHQPNMLTLLPHLKYFRQKLGKPGYYDILKINPDITNIYVSNIMNDNTKQEARENTIKTCEYVIKHFNAKTVHVKDVTFIKKTKYAGPTYQPAGKNDFYLDRFHFRWTKMLEGDTPALEAINVFEQNSKDYALTIESLGGNGKTKEAVRKSQLELVKQHYSALNKLRNGQRH